MLLPKGHVHQIGSVKVQAIGAGRMCVRVVSLTVPGYQFTSYHLPESKSGDQVQVFSLGQIYFISKLVLKLAYHILSE